MKLALLSSALLLCATGSWGCATSTGVEIDGGGGDGSLVDSGKKDTGTKTDSGQTQGQCVPSCSSDLDCQNSCPDVPNGINCCDTATGICYANASSTCPAPYDGGFD